MTLDSMTDKARQYTPSTKARLYLLSGNECYAPDCTKLLVAKDQKSIIAKICHIEAASQNGPRYRVDMTDDERRHFDNLILLCDECHIIIDNKENEDKYPVVLLNEWKKNHESKKMEVLTKNTSLLSTAINAIANIDPDEFEQTIAVPSGFDIEEKIKFNQIKRNKSWISSYSVYYTKINSLYDELEKAGSFKKEKLLRIINLVYLKVTGNYVGDSSEPLRVIQENADSIIEDIEDELLEKIGKNNKENLNEDLVFGISVIMVDAFMRCKILEKPTKK